ncbi:MAG: hypothetical protein AAB932_02885 [Patescibacteria group bacterium]
MTNHESDLKEKILVVDENNVPTGLVKERGLVHQDGDWHRITSV